MSTSTPSRGILVIISSPSGAGKTTLARRLLSEFEGHLSFSVSYTTRPIRKNERNGVDYHFVDDAEFSSMVEADEFAEWAEVHGNKYGTSRAAVDRALGSGTDVVFDVDWQGGQALSGAWPDDCLMVFILPPDLTILEQRLRRRATDTDDVIDRRLRMALVELEHHGEYQHLIINDDLEDAYQTLRAIYLVRKHRGDDEQSRTHELTQLAKRVRDNSGPAARQHADRMIAVVRDR